ncbi:MAG TPA: sulfotransferase, partial [Blastocatellia bacterium]|nr:sulfotransferase [Blastocatellia bacterium]
MDEQPKIAEAAGQENRMSAQRGGLGASQGNSIRRPRPDLTNDYEEPKSPFEKYLTARWQDAFALDRIGVRDNFFELGFDSLQAAIFLNRIQLDLREFVYVTALYDAPTIAGLAHYLETNYTAAVARLLAAVRGDPDSVNASHRREVHDCGVSDAMVTQMRDLIAAQSDQGVAAALAQKNPTAVFILAPPRSGTTLLRVMLAGHSRLFAPPELHLLRFQRMGEWKRLLTGKKAFWKEGAVRALMEIAQCDVTVAGKVLGVCEDNDITVKEFYGLMQRLLRGRVLVDKTPYYALDPRVLRRAESYFEQARYIHLVRDPRAAIRSFEEARLDQV